MIQVNFDPSGESLPFIVNGNDGVQVTGQNITGSITFLAVMPNGAEMAIKYGGTGVNAGDNIAFTADFTDVLQLRQGCVFKVAGGTAGADNIVLSGPVEVNRYQQ